ncbi:hypothetical protein RvY_00296 [Ramazzottius varieornatus]|uniref:CS domain-containing protein n=1 Tax=Ramazzottius varieornatus TaxID=947166 RepID=A0A1D1UD94_RAMVA|nr:hypothetical protein RvY_00296 [Ramazzottius varieornatus]
MASGKLIPSATWAQRKEVVFLTFLVQDVKDLDLKIEANRIHFEGSSDSKNYDFDLELYAEIDPEKSKYTKGDRVIDCLLQKKDTSAPFWPRLAKASGKQGWLKTDFARWKDEDDADDEEKGGFGGGDMDFTQMMGQMGGMGGMGGMGDMGGMNFGGPGGDDMPDSDDDKDDEDEEGMPKLE